MHEDMGKSEDVLTNVQTKKVRYVGRNVQRRVVSSFWVIFWCALALLSMSLWLLRLLGLVSFL